MVEEHTRHIGPDNQWATYEANVQAYRGLAMSAQSLYLAVGAILLGADLTLPFFAVMVMALVTAWYVFFPVIFARTAIVDFHKFNLRNRFDRDGNRVGEVPPDNRLLERHYASVWTGRALRKRVYSQIEMPNGQRFSTLRQTRWKLDVFVPGVVTIVWFIFAAYIVATV
jgi:hypothetical protein